MPIRWKVVTKDKKSCIISPKSEFSITYIKGKIIKERKKALGIMCFERLYQAENFNARFNSENVGQTIKVQGIGRGKRVGQITWINLNLSNFDELLLWFNSRIKNYRAAPPGTMCYKEVKVLT